MRSFSSFHAEIAKNLQLKPTIKKHGLGSEVKGLRCSCDSFVAFRRHCHLRLLSRVFATAPPMKHVHEGYGQGKKRWARGCECVTSRDKKHVASRRGAGRHVERAAVTNTPEKNFYEVIVNIWTIKNISIVITSYHDDVDIERVESFSVIK